MKCENCKHCKGGLLPESYEEEYWCEKGYGDPMEENGCWHFPLRSLKNLILHLYGLWRSQRFMKTGRW